MHVIRGQPKENSSAVRIGVSSKWPVGLIEGVSIVLPCPAKLNLFLAITGRRADGFHDLVSVAAPLEFGDTLSVDSRPTGFTLECDDPTLEVDQTNLVLRAAHAFAAAAKWSGGAHFSLQKRIPTGAGLGGGSSDATSVLLALNQLAGGVLTREQLASVAAQLGSDCALFLAGAPVVMRGRGERVHPLPLQAAERLSGRRVLIFKPMFSISTVWAYQRMAAGAPTAYLPEAEAEARLSAWINQPNAPAEALLYNNMEGPAFTKFIALPVLMEQLREEFNLTPSMSGSGSACFAFLPEGSAVSTITRRIRAFWGAEAFVMETRMS
jgi:4-diphosphocytidyl-2-C-methyl-D-erythritol kinase